MVHALLALALWAPPDPPLVRPHLEVAPAAGPVVIDGVLDEAAWEGAALATGFSEVRPTFGAVPPVRTEALLTYSESHIYVAFRALDDPAAVRATLGARDEIAADDYVGIALDPYGDGGRGYMLFSNPLGVQHDALRSGGEEDDGFDMVFETAGRLTETGYVVEMAVPFRSLRFPEGADRTWGLTFLRGHPRDRRRLYSWAPVDPGDPCILCQLGRVRGLRGASATAALEVLPAVVASQAAAAGPDGLEAGSLQPELSLGLRYALSSDVAVSATVNPDFSHVESDAAQLDVNSTFALSLPERRPFFQEGADLFATPIDVVYTRAIHAPAAAAKIAGRLGQTEFAALAAVDERTPLLLPFAERSRTLEAGRSASVVLRARRTVAEGSFVGATLTDRRLSGGGAGTLAAADAHLQLGGPYRLSGQVALSHTAEPDAPAWDAADDATFADGRHTAALDGESFGGLGGAVSVSRASRGWTFDVTYQGFSPAFRAATGFVRQNDLHTLKAYQGYQFRPSAALVQEVFPLVAVERAVGWDGAPRQTRLQAQLLTVFSHQTSLALAHAVFAETFRGVALGRYAYDVAILDSQPTEWLGLSAMAKVGTDVVRGRAAPVLGRTLGASLALTLKPSARIQLAPSLQYAAMYDRGTGEPYFEGLIARAQARLQATPELSLRLVGQYDGFRDRLSVEPLLAYQINPFSVVYLGSSHGYAADPARPHLDGYAAADRRLFFKVQYLLQH